LPLAFWAGTFFSIPPDTEPIPREQFQDYEEVIGTIELTEISERDTWPIDTMLMGVGWALATASLFSVVGSNARDRRLAMAGFLPWEILAARLSILSFVALAISLIPTILIPIFSDTAPTNLLLVWIGSLLMGFAGIAIGLIIGSVFPRQLEGTLVLIGVIGIEVGIPLTLDGRQFMPLFGSQAIFTAGRFAVDPIVLSPLIKSAIWTAGLIAVATTLWSRKVHVYRTS
jgi:hypothetical protein